MSRPRKKKSNAGKLAVAVLALGAGGVICVRNVLDVLRGPTQAAPDASTPTPVASNEPAPEGAASETDAAAVASELDAGAPAAPLIDVGDLLALVGSHTRGKAVPSVFTLHEPVVVAPVATANTSAAPAGETAATRAGSWIGADPLPLRVTFVMVGGERSRACVDGQVIGIGDKLGGGVVDAIEADGVAIKTAQRRLFYDLTDSWPREFRDEAARRAAAGKQADGKTGSKQ